MRILLSTLLFLTSSPAVADAPDIRTIVESQVLPGYQTLVDEAADLAETAATSCSPDNLELTAAYHDAFDAFRSPRAVTPPPPIPDWPRPLHLPADPEGSPSFWTAPLAEKGIGWKHPLVVTSTATERSPPTATCCSRQRTILTPRAASLAFGMQGTATNVWQNFHQAELGLTTSS